MEEFIFKESRFNNVSENKEFSSFDDGLSDLGIATDNVKDHFCDFNFFSTYTNPEWKTLELARQGITILFKTRNAKTNEAFRQFELFKVIRSYFKDLSSYTAVYSFYYSNRSEYQVTREFTGLVHFDAILSWLYDEKKRTRVIDEIMAKPSFVINGEVKFFGAFEQHQSGIWHYHCFTTHPFFLIGKTVMKIIYIGYDVILDTKKQIESYITKYISKNAQDNALKHSVRKIIKTNIKGIYDHVLSVLPQDEQEKDEVKYLYSGLYTFEKGEGKKLEDFQFLKDEGILNVITGEAGTGKTYRMIQIYNEKVAQGFKCYFGAITQKRQKSLNEQLGTNFKNFYKEFRFNRTLSCIISDESIDKYDYIFLDDISPMYQEHFVDFLDHLNFVKGIYCTWHGSQLKNLDLSGFVTEELVHQYRRVGDFQKVELNDGVMLVDELSYLQLIGQFKQAKGVSITNNNNLNRVLKYAISQGYEFTGKAYFTQNFGSIYNGMEIEVEKNEFKMGGEVFSVKQFLKYVRFVFNTYSIQGETYEETTSFVDWTYEYTSSDANLYVLSTRAQKKDSVFNYVVDKHFLKKIKKF